MKHISTIAILLLALLAETALMAQCTGGIAQAAITPTAAWQTVSSRAGRYKPFNAVAGTSYIFSYCQGGGSATWDTELTVNDNTGNYAGAYNDDACSLSSEVYWTCVTTGTYQILVNELPCGASAATATLAYRSFVPGPGTTCANPHNIPTLPFTATSLTTCGAGNDYTSLDACGSSYMNGEDYVFRYVATGPQTIRITLSNTLSYTGVFVVQGCPNAGGTCIAASAGGCGGGPNNTSFSGNPVADFNLPGAGTYYFIVDTWPSPNCTGFDINVQAVPSGSSGPGCGAYTITTPTYAPDAFNAGTLLAFPDDQFSATVSLPFTFCFMGTNYNSLIVSSNAYVSFNTACAGQNSSWNTDVIPSPANVNSPEASNSIMFPWVDVDPSVSGSIRYSTYGTAPNRRFVVAFRNVAMFDCNALLYTGEVVLYETTHVIDIYIQNLPNCASWNNGEAVMGLLDGSGTVAVPVPGLNNTAYTLSNYAVRFTPNCPTCTVLPVAFLDIQGRHEDGHNVVTWATASEMRSASFTLERSRDGQQFEAVGMRAGGGNAPTGGTYSMEDHMPFQPLTYYRVVQRDDDGAETHSDVIAVASGATATLAILQVHPSADAVQVRLNNVHSSQQVRVEVLDVMGKVIHAQAIHLATGDSDHVLQLGRQLSPGVYLLQVTDAAGMRQVRRFLVH